MNLSLEQLYSSLQDTQPLKPIYVISGDEPLQRMEACDAIRKAAVAQGYDERELMHIEPGFDWSSLAGHANALSLFSEKKLLDLRMEKVAPGKPGSKAFTEYAQQPPDDRILLINCGKLNASQRNAAWVKALGKHGAVVQVWDLSPAQTLGWVAKRLRQKGLQPTQDAVRLLTERVEGNLLAAAQEIDKLCLLHDGGELDEQQVLNAVTDSSRFTVFDLSQAVCLGDAKRIQHIVQHLKEEGEATSLVLWVLTDLLNQLSDVCRVVERGGNTSQALSKVPKPRQRQLQPAIKRMTGADWPSLFERAIRADRSIKGRSKIPNKGDSRTWVELLELGLALANRPLVPLVQ